MRLIVVLEPDFPLPVAAILLMNRRRSGNAHASAENVVEKKMAVAAGDQRICWRPECAIRPRELAGPVMCKWDRRAIGIDDRSIDASLLSEDDHQSADRSA